MSGPITEILYFKLKPEVTIDDAESESAKMWQGMVDKFVGSPGLEYVGWSRASESKETIIFAMIWTSMQAFREFSESEEEKKALANFVSIIDGPFKASLLETTSSAEGAFKAPTTEIFERYFSPDIDQETQDKVAEASLSFFKKMMPQVGTCTSSACGWGAELIEHEGQKVKVFTALGGWDSVEAHYAAFAHPVYQEDPDGLKLGSPVGMQLLHANLEQLGKK